jgi:hypothetical protein
MATALTFKSAGMFLVPVDDEGAAYCKKRAGQHIQVKVSQPRSLEQNAMLWSVATFTLEHLPERYEDRWSDRYRLVKGLQMALGIVDEIAVPTKDGMQIVRTPSSIAEMDHDEANAACDLLFRGMARLLDVTVDELLNEAQRRAA